MATYTGSSQQDQPTFHQAGLTGLQVTKKEKGKVAQGMCWGSWEEEG